MRQSKPHTGFIELYLSIGMFIIICAGTALIAQKQIKKIQLEKASWQIQNQLHQLSSKDENISSHRNEVIRNAKFTFTTKDILTNTKEKDHNFTMFNDNMIRIAQDLYHISSDYLACGTLPEPVSFLLMKNVLYRHMQETTEIRYPEQISDIAWVKNTLFSNQNPNASNAFKQPTLYASHERINKAFTGETFMQDTGWYMRQLLWMEGMHKSETYSALLPLQLVAVYELVITAKNILANPGPPIPFVRKPFKKIMKKVSDNIFSSDEIAPFLKDIMDISSQKSGSYNFEKCKSVKSPNIRSSL